MTTILHELEELPFVDTLHSIEDYLPAHKMPEFVPYDTVITLRDDGTPWSEARLSHLLTTHNITYDAICGVRSSDLHAEDTSIALVRLHPPVATC